LEWARVHLASTPLEVNRAEKSQLIRIPGIGPKGAEAIVTARRTGKLRDLSALKKLGILAECAAPYLLLDGRRAAQQLALF
jgi:predicted DNA-binding helix-hairpin-helix protein